MVGWGGTHVGVYSSIWALMHDSKDNRAVMLKLAQCQENLFDISTYLELGDKATLGITAL